MVSLRATDLVEIILPDGRRVVVDFGDGFDHPDLEGDVVQTLFDVECTDRDICEAVADYAREIGLTARFFLGRDSVIVAIGEVTGDSLPGNGRRRYGSDIAAPRRVSAAATIRT